MTSPDETLRASAPEPEADPGEAEAWARVVAAWEDEAVHGAYLARFHDLAGLAVAGRRYRDALAARPEDPFAARFRDEVIRRATVQGFALLPRSAPTPARSVGLRRLLLVVAAALLGAAAFAAFHLLAPLGARS
ncbi:hypothetical protein [Anaeromyxobacter terrae]|uniref:hypothetical protein n=1 Tax=Anaeromyxobacter terrae TaxID=2925406 RepID=UPI001F56A418|nr:hypothetical protein [Anaeromyxobacter sp. SG22]